MATDAPQPKLTYKVKSKLEVFYTGGAARITQDGNNLVCGSGDEIKIVDIASGCVVRTFAGDSELITAVAVSPDNTTIFAASRSLACRCLNIATGETIRTWKAHKGPVADMAVDASGGYLATASADRSVKVWDVQAGFVTHHFQGHSGVVLRVLFHPREMLLVSSGEDSEVRVWDLVDKTCTAVLKGHFSAVTGLSLAADGWHLLSGSRDRVVIVWDLRRHEKVTAIPVYEVLEGLVAVPYSSAFPGVTPPPAGAKGAKKPIFFATAGDKGIVRVWRSDTGACVYDPPAPATQSASSQLVDIAMLPGGAGVLCSTADARLMILEAQEVEGGVRSLQLRKQLLGNIDEVTDVRFVGPPGSPTHLLVSSNSEVMQLLDLEGLGCSASLVGHKETVLCLDAQHITADSRDIVASGAKDSCLRVWEVPSGRCLGLGAGHIGAVAAVALARRGAKFAVTGGADKLIKVWDLSPCLAPGAADHSPVKLVVTAAVAGHDKDINCVALAPNDTLMVSASQDRTAKVWKLPGLIPQVTLRGHRRGVWCAEFSPVDQAVITASGDKTVKLWALRDGACLRTFEGHTASVLRCSFVTAGSQVLSGGADGLVKLWSIRSSECVATFDEHQDKIWAMATGGQHERLMATGGADAVLAVWEDSTAVDAAAAAQVEEETIQQEQQLANALMDGDFAAAARIAFKLRHPGRLLAVLNDTARMGAGGSEVLEQLVAHMAQGDVSTALEMVREWNTNARHCHAAQTLLHALLRSRPPADLLAIQGSRELLDGLVAYTQRHFARIDRLLRSSYLLDYTLAAMNVLHPSADLGGEEQQQQEEEEWAQAVEAPLGSVANGVHHAAPDSEEEEEPGATQRPMRPAGILEMDELPSSRPAPGTATAELDDLRLPSWADGPQSTPAAATESKQQRSDGKGKKKGARGQDGQTPRKHGQDSQRGGGGGDPKQAGSGTPARSVGEQSPGNGTGSAPGSMQRSGGKGKREGPKGPGRGRAGQGPGRGGSGPRKAGGNAGDRRSGTAGPGGPVKKAMKKSGGSRRPSPGQAGKANGRPMRPGQKPRQKPGRSPQ